MARKSKPMADAVSNDTTSEVMNTGSDTNEQPKTTFMDLPVEIRTHIYVYVFEEKLPITLEMRHPKSSSRREVWRRGAAKRPGKVYNRSTRRWEPAPLKNISILFACRQIFLEAEPVLYGCNILRFERTLSLNDFIERVGPRAQHIRHVHIIHGGYQKSTARGAFNALSVAKGLHTLRISGDSCLHPDFVMYPKITPATVAQDCKVLMKALYKHKKEHDLTGNVLDILELEGPRHCRQCGNSGGDGCTTKFAKMQSEARAVMSKYLGLDA